MNKSRKIILGITIVAVIVLGYALYWQFENKEAKESLNESSHSHEETHNTTEGSEIEIFKNTIVNIYENMKEMKGQEVTISGFVHREQGLSQDRFVVSRILMNKHEDHYHEQLAGVLCEWKDSSQLEDKEWVKVTGIVDTEDYYNKDTDSKTLMPIIKAIKVEMIDPPQDKNKYE